MRLVVTVSMCLVLAAPVAVATANGEAGRYLTVGEFVDSVYPEGAPAVMTLWVHGELREAAESMLGHAFGSLRVRYWFNGETSAWILDEIGKELPITIGVAVAQGAIRDVRILEFRESRGWEVRFPFFTDQFREATLRNDGRLDRKIDNITGATLSVKAVTRIARVALVFHDHVAKTE